MFFRQKRSGDHVYLQIVENRWEKGGSKQRVIATVGRLDPLQKNGQLDGLLQSGAKFAEAVMVLAAHRQGKTPSIRTFRIGPAMVFGRLWEELHIPQVIQRLLAGRRFGLAVERIRRYVVCQNEEQAKKDRADREAIVECLREQLKHGDKSLVGNKGYRKYLHAVGPKFTIDEAKVKGEERFDGKWVLQTDLEELTAEDTALQYKQLWMVEEMFRTVKTLLETRPIFHKCDETIRGHVFCSFLALLLRKELQDRLEAQGDKWEWAELLRDLESLQYTEVKSQGKRFLLRSDLAGTTAAVFRAAGVAIPMSVQQIEE